MIQDEYEILQNSREYQMLKQRVKELEVENKKLKSERNDLTIQLISCQSKLPR